jgi:hypothetical protein
MPMSTDAYETEVGVEGTARTMSPSVLPAQLGVALPELARLAGIARATLVSKLTAGRVEAALRPIVRILDVAVELAGDGSRAAI